MIYIIFGILFVLFIIDLVWLKPQTRNRKTDNLLARLRQKNHVFYASLPKFTKQRGIVMTIEDNSVVQCALLIATLRILKCALQIHLYYLPDELSSANILFLESMNNVNCTNLTRMVGMTVEAMRHTKKIYALVYSPFVEVILLDPDLVFLRNPVFLFGDPMYQGSGALFWKDRAVTSHWDKQVYDWIGRLVPYRQGDNRILDKRSGSFQAREIIVFNKSRHFGILEKLWVFAGEPDIVFSCLHGLKELFWISAELAKEPYTFCQSYPGVIGEPKKMPATADELCGHTLFMDPSGNPLLFSGSIFDAKDMRKVSEFTHLAFYGGSSKWKVLLGASSDCLQQCSLVELSPDLRNLLNDYTKVLFDIQNRIFVPDDE